MKFLEPTNVRIIPVYEEYINIYSDEASQKTVEEVLTRLSIECNLPFWSPPEVMELESHSRPSPALLVTNKPKTSRNPFRVYPSEININSKKKFRKLAKELALEFDKSNLTTTTLL